MRRGFSTTTGRHSASPRVLGANAPPSWLGDIRGLHFMLKKQPEAGSLVRCCRCCPRCHPLCGPVPALSVVRAGNGAEVEMARLRKSPGNKCCPRDKGNKCNELNSQWICCFPPFPQGMEGRHRRPFPVGTALSLLLFWGRLLLYIGLCGRCWHGWFFFSALFSRGI